MKDIQDLTDENYITSLKTSLKDLNTYFMYWKTQCCKDISSSKITSQTESNPKQNPTRISSGNRKADSKIDLQVNSQDNLGGGKRKLEDLNYWIGNLLRSYNVYNSTELTQTQTDEWMGPRNRTTHIQFLDS